MSHRRLAAVILAALALTAWAPTASAADGPQMSVAPASRTVGPGAPALFTLTLTNADILPRTYALSMDNSSLVPGWTHSFEPPRLDVDAQKSATSTLVLTPLNDTVGGPFNFTVLANAVGPVGGGAPATAFVEVTVEAAQLGTTETGPTAAEPLRLALATGDASGAPGEVAEGGLTVVSNDPRTLRLDFDITGPASWQPRVSDGFRVMYQGNILQSRLSVTVPAGVAEGTTQTFTITATDAELGESVSTVWRVTATGTEAPAPEETSEPAPAEDEPGTTSPTPTNPSPVAAPPTSIAVRVDVLQPSVEVRAGESGSNQLQIANIGTVPVRVELTGIGHATWDRFTFLNDSNMPIAELDLGVGITRYIPFTWDVPGEIPPSTIAARVTARGIDNADLVKTVTFDIKVLAALELPPPAAPKTTEAASLEGDSATVAVPAAWGVAAGLGAVGVGALALARRPMREKMIWGAVGLYTRLARPDILGHDEREKLYRLIETNPGVHFHALQRELSWNTGTLTYHLRVLEKHGFVVSRKDGFYRRFYVQGAAPRKETFVDGPTGLRADVLEAIRNQHGMSQTDLSLALGANKQTVNYHVKALERAGLIRVEKRGRETFLYPAGAPSTGSEPAAA